MLQPSDFKQSKWYNCGPTSLSYLLYITAKKQIHPHDLESLIGCNTTSGTSHEGIENYLNSEGIAFKSGIFSLHEIELPLLVNYQFEGEGHYGVITNIYLNGKNGFVDILEVSAGNFIQMQWKDFVSVWYSTRYGPHWGLHLL